MNVALLVPEAERAIHSGLAGALTDHYRSPGRLADYRRKFEKPVRRDRENPSIFVPGRLHASRCLQFRLMTPTFPLLQCRHLPAGVAATSAFGPELTPAPAQPQPVITQKYHSPPGSGSSTPLYDLAEFNSANSSVARSELDVASVVPSDILPIVARFTPLNPPGSQVSHLTSVQLSLNRVRSDFDPDMVDLDPSSRSAGELLLISPISSPESPLSCASPGRTSRLHRFTAAARVQQRRCPSPIYSS